MHEVEVLVELAASAQREMKLRRAVASAVNATDLIQEKALDLQRSNEQLEEQAARMLVQAAVRHSIGSFDRLIRSSDTRGGLRASWGVVSCVP
ncbi:MAG: hypothetical protein Q8K82_19565 [Gemmatimonadaceae bacterium]|nr:hypothetical protein [Gemmatimonadaceae bacterium]